MGPSRYYSRLSFSIALSSGPNGVKRRKLIISEPDLDLIFVFPRSGPVNGRLWDYTLNLAKTIVLRQAKP